MFEINYKLKKLKSGCMQTYVDTRFRDLVTFYLFIFAMLGNLSFIWSVELEMCT